MSTNLLSKNMVAGPRTSEGLILHGLMFMAKTNASPYMVLVDVYGINIR